MTMIAEGAEAKRQEDAVTERKRKADEKERWEGASLPFLFLPVPPHFPPSSFTLSHRSRADADYIWVAAETREDRVTDWRKFQGGKKKKSKKTNVLG